MSQRFEGKVALITGAASGIGAATARRLHAEGARLVLGDLQAEALAAFAKTLDASGSTLLTRELDVADRAQVESFVDAGAERFGRLDVLFNNAGIGAYGRTPDLDPEVWKRTIEVDLHSVFYGCRAAIPHLRRAGGGAIVNTASISGMGGDYGLAAYNAAKGAVLNYTRTLAIDHARDGIRVNCRLSRADRHAARGPAARERDDRARVPRADPDGTRRPRRGGGVGGRLPRLGRRRLRDGRRDRRRWRAHRRDRPAELHAHPRGRLSRGRARPTVQQPATRVRNETQS